MIPELGEVREVEQLAASEVPSYEGAWWIMLQTAESICNYASRRDPINNAFLSEFWTEAAAKIETILESESERPFPYDDLMQMVSFCGNQLQNIVSNPRHNIVKVDKLVRPYRVQNTGFKTMNWLGKQPGKTIKEKLAGKEKMLTQVNEYSFDIRENQVAMMLYKQIMRRISDRVSYGIKQNGYDLVDSAELDQFQKIKKQLRNSPLAEVKPQNHRQANNALLSDKNYSIVWRAYMDMVKFDKRLADNWDNALSMYVKATFLAINAELLSYKDVYVIEERIKLNKNNMNVTYIIGYHWKIPYVVKMAVEDNTIFIRVYDAPYNESKTYDSEMNLKLKVVENPDKKALVHKHGTPIVVKVEEGKEKAEIPIYADLSGVRNVLSFLVNKVFQFTGIEPEKCNKDMEYIEGSISFDIVANGDFIGGENSENQVIDCFYAKKSVSYSDSNGIKTAYPGRDKCIHYKSDEQISINDAIVNQNNEGLKAAISDICKKVIQSNDDYFFYLVPDALEEILQKNLKQTVRASFARTFPVWRSVSAITYWLSIADVEFAAEDVFAYIDLVGEAATAGMLTIHEEKFLDDYACSHFPPMPQSGLGESITETAFCSKYIELYATNRGIAVPEVAIDGLLKSGAVKNLILGDNYANYFIEEKNAPHLYQLEYDSDILLECVEDWIKNAKRFWKSIQDCFDSNHKPSRLLLLSDVVVSAFVQLEIENDLYEILDGEDIGIYQCGESQLLSGALVFKKRLNEHLPTWTEYLPKLSLEVIKDGDYAQLELIGDEVSFDVMGDDNEHKVEEKLILKAGEKEFNFPLIKQDISRKATMLDAYITDKSFPLDHDVVVSLLVKYRYGFDNSYELILKPLDGEEKSFKEIVVEWADTERRINIENIWPPATNRLADEIVLLAIDEARDSFNKIQFSIEKHMVNYISPSDKTYPIQQTDKFLNRNIFKLRNIVLSDLPEAAEFIQWLIDKPIYKYLEEIVGMSKHNSIPESFFIDNAGMQMEFFKGDCLQVMFSIGKYTPQVIQKHFIENYYSYNEKSRMKAMVDMLLRNGTNKSGIITVVDEIRNATDNDSYNVKMDALVRELGRMCCFDSDLVYDFYDTDPSFMHEMTNFIISGIRRMLNRCERIGDDYRADRKSVKRYISYTVALLSFLRLRDANRAEGFQLLAVASEDSKKLAREIRDLDEYMSRERPISPMVRFKINKPESLSKMSDLSYALDLYLKGDKQAAAIEVVGVDDED